MPDPYLIGGGVVAYLSKDGVAKLLGPTAEYLGDGLRNFTQKRVENIASIFRSAEDKLGHDIEREGRVSPKVLKEILEGGSYTEDELAIQYFGGVLASSRTNVNRDDRGARVSKMIGTMSSYQLRAHYIIYNSVASLFFNKGFSASHTDRTKMNVFFPLTAFVRAMDFDLNEIQQFSSIMRHTFFGLHSDNLIEGRFEYGNGVKYFSGTGEIEDAGVVCQPSGLGVDVFLWAHGKGMLGSDAIFAQDFAASVDKEIVEISDARPASRAQHT